MPTHANVSVQDMWPLAQLYMPLQHMQQPYMPLEHMQQPPTTHEVHKSRHLLPAPHTWNFRVTMTTATDVAVCALTMAVRN